METYANNLTIEKKVLGPSPRQQSDLKYLEDLRKKFNTSGGNESFTTDLCGFPSFCSSQSYNLCTEVTLSQCNECSMIVVAVVAAVYVVLGTFILSGNGLVIWNVLSNKKGFQDVYSKIRGSLAFADFLTGILIFAIILPNLIWIIQRTPNEINLQQLESEGSLSAIAGGFFYILGFTSSLFHLVLLSMQRLYAVAFPMKYKLQTQVFTLFSLGCVWSLAAVSAIFPVFFPETLAFTYHPNLFLYMASKTTPSETYNATTMSGNSYVAESVVLSILVVLPFLLVIVLSLTTGCWVSKYYKTQFRRLTVSQSNPKQRSSKQETRIFKTIFFMQLGFLVTIVPFITAFALLFSGVLQCDNQSSPILICIILSISNSLINVLIYVTTDKKFRKSILDMFKRNPQKNSSFKTNSSKSTRSHSSTKSIPSNTNMTRLFKRFKFKGKTSQKSADENQNH